MQNQNLHVVLLFGPPGSGKGTQADLLAMKFGFVHLDSSKVLEEWFRNVKDEEYVEIDEKKYYAREERKLWETGILMSPPVVAHVMKEEIRKIHGAGKSMVTSGSLRTLYEAESLYPVLEELYEKNIIVFSLKIDPEQSIYRNSHRRICELMRHSILLNQETEGLSLCPVDGSSLVRREGLDNAETIKTRLKEYEERTRPVLDYLEHKDMFIQKIDGNQSVTDVFGDILQTLEKK